MTALLQRLHARLGDFWWYSLMLFVACRAADVWNFSLATQDEEKK